MTIKKNGLFSAFRLPNQGIPIIGAPKTVSITVHVDIATGKITMDENLDKNLDPRFVVDVLLAQAQALHRGFWQVQAAIEQGKMPGMVQGQTDEETNGGNESA